MEHRLRSVARTVYSRRRINGRAMELVNGHKSFLALSNPVALSLFDASFNFARACSFDLGQLCVWSKEHWEESYLFSVLS